MAAVYRPPGAPGDIASLLNFLDRGLIDGTPCVITGDFNLPEINWVRLNVQGGVNSKEFRFLEFTVSRGLEQIVLTPTRHAPDSILDLFLCSDPNLVIDLSVTPPFSTSDHDSVEALLSVEVESAGIKPRTRRNFYRANYPKIASSLQTVDWDQLFAGRTLQEAWQSLIGELNPLIEQFVPLQSIAKKPKLNWSKECHKLERKQKAVHKVFCRTGLVEHKQRAKDLARELRKLRRREERVREERLLASGDEKTFWKFVNGKVNTRVEIPVLKTLAGELISDGLAKANFFNDYFATVFQPGTSEKPTFQKQTENNLSFVAFRPEMVYVFLTELQNKHSPGPDGLGQLFLKRLAFQLAYPLTMIFRKSLELGQLPSDWKLANVTPIFKKGLTSKVENYRPIKSNLSVL